MKRHSYWHNIGALLYKNKKKKGPITANAIYIHIPVMMMVKVIFMKQVKTEQMACSLFSLFHLYSQLWMPNKTAAYQAIT